MRRVLIIKLGALGDAVIATPAIRQIQAHHAGARVALLTSDEVAPLFRRWPGLEVAAFPRRGLRALLRLLCWVRAQRFERLYDLQSNDRTALICALSGVPERVGNHPRYPYTHHPADRYRGQCHIHERLLAVLRTAGIDARPESPSLPAAQDETRHVEHWLEARGLRGRPFALLHAGSSPAHPEKRWPGFGDLASALRRAGLAVVWLGGPDDAVLNRGLAASAGVDASSEFSLIEIAELGRHARFAVVNDSAPMHVLACSGIPVFGLFGPTDWRRQHAVGQRDRAIAARPAQSAFAPAPLDEISVDRVLERLRAAALIA